MPFDWNQPVRMTGLLTDVALNGGKVEAPLETSDDGFATVAEKIPLTLPDGLQSNNIPTQKPGKFVRLRLHLTASSDRQQTPRVNRFVLSGTPLPTSEPR